MIRYISRSELNSILANHSKWIMGHGGTRADLRGADLTDANLRGADLTDANLPHFQIPQHGELRVYKAVDGKIVHLQIPRGAKRTACLTSRKCRAEKAFVLAIEGDLAVATRGVTYEVGELVYPDSYDDDVRVECTHGIHFFMTIEEAEEWAGRQGEVAV